MEGPFGTAHDTNTPSVSSRKSKCRRRAECFCTTNSNGRLIFADRLGLPFGSGVFFRSRFRQYSCSISFLPSHRHLRARNDLAGSFLLLGMLALTFPGSAFRFRGSPAGLPGSSRTG